MKTETNTNVLFLVNSPKGLKRTFPLRHYFDGRSAFNEVNDMGPVVKLSFNIALMMRAKCHEFSFWLSPLLLCETIKKFSKAPFCM